MGKADFDTARNDTPSSFPDRTAFTIL